MEEDLAVSQKVKHKSIKWPSNSMPRYIPKRKKNNIWPHKILYTNVHCSIIHKRQKVEKTLLSINWQQDKQNVVYPYNGILFGHKNEVLIHATVWTLKTLCQVKKKKKKKKGKKKSLSQKTPCIGYVQKRQILRAENRLDFQDWGVGGVWRMGTKR